MIKKTDLQDCLNDKLISDKNYFDALQEFNSIAMEDSLEKSKNYGTCASDLRIDFNAKLEIYKRLSYYYTILSKKLNYLQNKENLLIHDYNRYDQDTIQQINETLLLNNL
ncbi:MAG: hypothetical protein GXP45_04300 [bacterium]|nr:hypothetical protein [bacterium]